eukprot:458318-Amphidinium_carterae.1
MELSVPKLYHHHRPRSSQEQKYKRTSVFGALGRWRWYNFWNCWDSCLSLRLKDSWVVMSVAWCKAQRIGRDGAVELATTICVRSAWS